MNNLRTAAQQTLEALELGYDSAKAEADQYHAAMAGYRPQRHAEMDADVQKIARAITALRAALAEPVQDGKCKHCVDGCPACDARKLLVQEPAAWRYKKEGGGWFVSDNEPQYVEQWNDIEEIQPLYTAPPQRKPEPVQEPVAWVHPTQGHMQRRTETMSPEVVASYGRGGWTPLYAVPPQRKPLTEEEIREMFFAELRALPSYPSAIEELPERLARAIERAYGIT